MVDAITAYDGSYNIIEDETGGSALEATDEADLFVLDEANWNNCVIDRTVIAGFDASGDVIDARAYGIVTDEDVADLLANHVSERKIFYKLGSTEITFSDGEEVGVSDSDLKPAPLTADNFVTETRDVTARFPFPASNEQETGSLTIIAANEYRSTISIFSGDEVSHYLSYDGIREESRVDAGYELITGPENGFVTINPDGTFTYKADESFVGRDQFKYSYYNRSEQIYVWGKIDINVLDPDTAVGSGGLVSAIYSTDHNDVIYNGPVDSSNADGVRQVGTIGITPSDIQITRYDPIIGSWQTYPDIIELDNGYTVITWTAQDMDGTAYNVYARIYNERGETVADNIEVNSTVRADNQERAVVTDLGGGQFAVTWQSESGGLGDAYDIYTRIFNADGTAESDTISVATTIGSGLDPVTDGPDVSSAPLSDGSGYGVTWSAFEGATGTSMRLPFLQTARCLPRLRLM